MKGLDGVGVVGIKEERRKKQKKRVWVRGWRRKKEGKKKKKKGRRAHVCVCGEKKKLYHNIFTINLKVGYY